MFIKTFNGEAILNTESISEIKIKREYKNTWNIEALITGVGRYVLNVAPTEEEAKSILNDLLININE